MAAFGAASVEVCAKTVSIRNNVVHESNKKIHLNYIVLNEFILLALTS